MSGVRRSFITAFGFILGMTLLAPAQTSGANPSGAEQKADSEHAGVSDRGNVGTAASTSQREELKPTVEQEIEALKQRINQLEDEVSRARAEKLGDGTSDAAALKTATKQLVAGNGSGAGTATPAPT